jgi:tetratricopeptide (TPR) repeat protein
VFIKLLSHFHIAFLTLPNHLPFRILQQMSTNKNRMKKTIILMLLAIANFTGFSQDAATLMDEGRKLEQQFKEDEALAKYSSALQIQPTNVLAAVKCAELQCSIGAKQPNEELKKSRYTEAKNFATTALRIDPQSADANYINAVVYGKLTEVEKKNEAVVDAVRNIRVYADKTLAINPNYGKAWNVLGKWHFEMLNLNAIKKAAVKILYGGLPKSNIDSCVNAFEKCKALEPYYCRNYLDLAKAYNYSKQYEKALATLQQCIKAPTRSADDVELKKEAKELMVKWQ